MKILIIEDEKQIAELLVKTLAPLTTGTPIVCTNMEDALAIIESAEALDIISVDLNLPGSGAEATIARLQYIADRKPEALVVVVSGIVTREDESRIIAAGAHGFIHKTDLRSPLTFMEKLFQIGRSMLACPQNYKRNIAVVETVAKTVGRYLSEAMPAGK